MFLKHLLGRSVGIVRSRTRDRGFCLFFMPLLTNKTQTTRIHELLFMINELHSDNRELVKGRHFKAFPFHNDFPVGQNVAWIVP
jgi:hypothetical protein